MAKSQQHYRSKGRTVIDLLKKHGVNRIDTARTYGDEGSSEKFLHEALDWKSQGLVVDTKLASFVPGSHSPDKLRQSLEESISLLHPDASHKINVLYLHSPDRSVSFEDTLKELNQLHKEGKYTELGISMYTAEEVQQLVDIAKKNNWIAPTVYQGSYNLLHRTGEDPLFPTLRKNGISFFAYSPLAGGFLSGKLDKDQSKAEKGGRFNQETSFLGDLYWKQYGKDSMFDGVKELKEKGEKFGLTPNEIALRWLKHHSQLNEKYGDGIIFGGSKLPYVESNLADLDKGPLPQEIVEAVDKLWENVKHEAQEYHR